MRRNGVLRLPDAIHDAAMEIRRGGDVALGGWDEGMRLVA
jgi:hypothetical protein